MTIEPISSVTSTFELTRTDPAHIGTSPIEKISKVGSGAQTAETSLTSSSSNKSSFQRDRKSVV